MYIFGIKLHSYEIVIISIFIRVKYSDHQESQALQPTLALHYSFEFKVWSDTWAVFRYITYSAIFARDAISHPSRRWQVLLHTWLVTPVRVDSRQCIVCWHRLTAGHARNGLSWQRIGSLARTPWKFPFSGAKLY